MTIKESVNVEFKRQFIDDLNKTVIAFANTDGGTVFIGVEDDGTVIGISDTDDVMLRVSGTIRNTIKPDVSMFTTCHIEEIEGKNVVVLQVNKGTSCPYYLSGKGIRPEGVYVRIGSSTVPATEASILKMIKETGGDSFEASRSRNQELTFEYATNEFASAGIAFGEAQKKTLRLINSDGLYTNLALLLSDQCEHTIKAAVFGGKDKEVFHDRYEFSGSLLKQISETYEYIYRYNRTSAQFEGLKRIDKREYPIEAIREVLLNAAVHRDYALGGSTLISIFDDRIEFLSLGGLAKGIEYDDILLGASITRNPYLANVFYRLHLIEAYGTGIPKVMKSYRSFDKKPKIEISNNVFKFILYNTTVYDIPTSKISENQQIVLELCKTQKSITRSDVEKALSVSMATAIRILSELTENGLLQKIGDGRSTRYTTI